MSWGLARVKWGGVRLVAVTEEDARHLFGTRQEDAWHRFKQQFAL